MIKWFEIVVVCFLVFVVTAVSYAVDGPFVIKNDRLEFPDGSSVATAPRDGKSILNGSGAPGVLTAQPGDFYLDTQNSRLYGPYSGSWGSGVSLVGPQGQQGTTGPQGPAGTCSGVVCTGTVPTVDRYMTATSSNPIPNETTTNFARIIEYFPYNASGSGNISGFGNNLGVQFGSGTTSGLAVFYFLKYDPVTGFIDQTFTPIKVGGGRWYMTTINGSAALFVDSAAVRYAVPPFYYTVYNNNLTRGYVVPGPVSPMTQTASFTAENLNTKTAKLYFPKGVIWVSFASGGTGTVTNTDGSQSSVTWSIAADGKLNVASMTFKIVGGAGSQWTVTYFDGRFTSPATELGPITLEIY